MAARLVIFDLDGTLLDTGKGIRNSVRHAEKQMGLLPLNDDALDKFIGPAPRDSYMRYHNLSREMANMAVRFHREYAEMRGIYEAEMYDGIDVILSRLKSHAVILAVATLKRGDLAIKILEHFNLANYFHEICGTDVHESLSKEDLIRFILQKTKCTAEQAVMIGDTEQDYAAAKACHVAFLGVTYGYGFHSTSDLHYSAANSTQLAVCLNNLISPDVVPFFSLR